jgi:hypothetical protein
MSRPLARLGLAGLRASRTAQPLAARAFLATVPATRALSSSAVARASAPSTADYAKGASALDKASQMFFFTEIVRGEWIWGWAVVDRGTERREDWASGSERELGVGVWEGAEESEEKRWRARTQDMHVDTPARSTHCRRACHGKECTAGLVTLRPPARPIRTVLLVVCHRSALVCMPPCALHHR